LRPRGAGWIIIGGSIIGGLVVCHDDWWFLRRAEERETSRRLWDEFARTRPLSEPEVTEEKHEVTLEKPETTRLAVKD
jgi:hypothetical protein